MNTVSRKDKPVSAQVCAPELSVSDIPQPTKIQVRWMKRGVAQPGGKIPLFDDNGQKVNARTVKSCLEHGWVEPWFSNPIKPDWIICKLTSKGRKIIATKSDN